MPDVAWNKAQWGSRFTWSHQGGEEWSGAWGSSEAQWYGSLLPRLRQFLPTHTVLEIAPGYGRWTRQLTRVCERYIGVDVTAVCTEHCARQFAGLNATFVTNDGYDLSAVQDGSIDLVFSFDSLVHVEQDVLSAYVGQIVSKLRPYGVAFLHHSNLASLPIAAIGDRSKSVDGATIRSMVAGAGGQILRQEIIQWDVVAGLDCLTLFSRKGDYLDEPAVYENQDFMVEADLIRRCVAPWSFRQANGSPSSDANSLQSRGQTPSSAGAELPKPAPSASEAGGPRPTSGDANAPSLGSAIPVQPTRLLFSGVDPERLHPLIDVYSWVHTIEFGNGRRTNGLWGGGSPIIWKALDDIDFRGKKVLDIGCWDGVYSFEAEKRGAHEVYATDMVSQRSFSDHPTFHLAHRLLNSKARYFDDMSVYDVPTMGVRDFDAVLYAGVYYHLKDPVRSLDALRSVMRKGGVILVEGAILEDEGCLAKYYHRHLFCGDITNWWVPTKECLEQWVESCGFAISARYERWGHQENQRHTLLATAV